MTDSMPPSPGPARSDAGRGDAHAAEIERLRLEIGLRDDILSLAAHELRNPLHALAMHLALARTMAQNGAGPDAAERIRRAESTLKRYSERVTVLMELLASPGAVYPLAPRLVDVVSLVETLVESLDQEARSRGIKVRVIDETAQMRRRLVDPVVLEQAVDNLLLNAFKHSGATEVDIRMRSDSACWTLQVEDNGRGIALEDQGAIFEKFAVASHSARGSGTGLGLWIITRLVQAMQGHIALESTPGQGCVFTLRIPETDEMRPTR